MSGLECLYGLAGLLRTIFRSDGVQILIYLEVNNLEVILYMKT